MTRSSHETNDSLTETVRTALAEFGVRDETVVVAVSGGPDSVALLHILIELRDGFGLQLHVAHLNHMLRGEHGARDAEFVAALARRLEVPCTCEERDVPAYQRASENSSLEDAARRVRYQFLNETADRVGATRIALGHMAGDQAETVLLHLVRGTGLSGLRGMLPVRGRIIRPLLAVPRDEIEAFLNAKGTEYCSDETNASRRFARNKIRVDVIPLLQREFNPRVVDSILRTAQVVRSAEEWAEFELERSFERLVVDRDESGLSFSADALMDSPAMLRRLTVRRAIRECAVETLNLSLAQVEATEALLFAADRRGQISLPGGLLARRTEDRLEIRQEGGKESSEAWSLPVEVPGTYRIPDSNITLSCEIMPRSGEPAGQPKTAPDEAFMDWGRVTGHMVIRNRRPGDRFHPLGAPGSRKLKDFFIDIKVPQPERDRIPLLADEDGIICVLGYVIAERVRVQPETETLLHVVLR